jgi:hypothetical protein
MSAPRWLAGAAIAAALVGSAVLVASAPDNDGITAPFFVRGGVGDTVSARNLTAVVESVSLTDYLDVRYNDAGDTSTDGVWVVVDTVLTARLDTTILNAAELWIGDVRYRVSDILPAPTPLQLSYGAGIAERGSLVFEIPLSALDAPGASRASIVLFDKGDARLDSVPVVVVDLTQLEISARERIDEQVVVDK